MFYVYVLGNSITGKRYIGYTNNLEERIRKHNTDHSGYIGQQGEWPLTYHEQYDTKAEALLREKFLKSGKGRDFLNSLSK